MNRKKKESGKPIVKKAKKKPGGETDKKNAENIEDVKKLVHLLEVHQIELEHQNEELRIAQEELEVSRNKYVNLFDFSPIPYFTLNPDGIITEVNLSAGKMLGADRKRIIGRNFITYILPGERDTYNSFITTVFNSPVKQSCELKIKNKDKHIFHVLMEGLKLIDTLEPDQKCQVALIDLTEYKNVENSLKESSEELKLLNNTKDKFFSIIAHDLRSPFQSLLSSSELMAKEIETLTQEEIVLFSKELNVSLKNLFELLENLLNWSMMQRDMIEYVPENINLLEIVTNIVEIANQNATEKSISISNNVKKGITVQADKNMLNSIIQNLLMNAIKFTLKAGQIIVSSSEKKDFVEVSIKDNGIGIEPGKISKLFDFHALNTTLGTNGERGTGLGLPLCKEYIERNHGKIWIESELEKGSKFSFILPKTNV